MAIPYRHYDMEKIAAEVEQHMENTPEEECEAHMLEEHEKGDQIYKQWLSYYDDNGYLKPGARNDPEYIPEMSYAFLAMPEDERAIFIISEKKRMGLL